MPNKSQIHIKLNGQQSLCLGLFLAIIFIVVIKVLQANYSDQLSEPGLITQTNETSGFTYTYPDLLKNPVMIPPDNMSENGPITLQNDFRKAIQAGAFQQLTDAQNMVLRLASLGVESQIQSSQIVNNIIYRVRIGPFIDVAAIDMTKVLLESAGIYSITIDL
jgi:hypothetical protein